MAIAASPAASRLARRSDLWGRAALPAAQTGYAALDAELAGGGGGLGGLRGFLPYRGHWRVQIVRRVGPDAAGHASLGPPPPA